MSSQSSVRFQRPIAPSSRAFPYDPLFPSYDKTACCEYVECDGDGFITSISLVDLTDPLTCKLSMPDFSSLTNSQNCECSLYPTCRIKPAFRELRNSQIGGDMPTCLPPALAWL
ncbi:hypothetical protein BCR33DRAFT_531997 [Rhizoclosmatium globosum]|uniref:Uncharacterized protein n=1 Tax=Rhizoclosmatium globosum TaxID=329046 RepID=A0A1Y2CU37_9FUNG|nr:hypothetical protein BCR33DRAFT_531997 [Rhizoclosmatium globosum]|eukprot:ORY50558.1 hypothetical protein BCR33DRAFT_531997 [Rhizoclosmatium globosum]